MENMTLHLVESLLLATVDGQQVCTHLRVCALPLPSLQSCHSSLVVTSGVSDSSVHYDVAHSLCVAGL